MRQPEADLTAFARNNLEQLGLSTTLTSKATETVSRVMEAAFWKRAQAQRYVLCRNTLSASAFT